ncbi:MAG: hypothetical protein WC003_15365 [Terrimicrobiaceae bacterium]
MLRKNFKKPFAAPPRATFFTVSIINFKQIPIMKIPHCKNLFFTLIALVALTLGASSSQAQTIVSTQFAPTGWGAAYPLTSGESAGFVPAQNWNTLQAQGGNSGLTNLVDSTGAATTVDLTYTSDSTNIELARKLH